MSSPVERRVPVSVAAAVFALAWGIGGCRSDARRIDNPPYVHRNVVPPAIVAPAVVRLAADERQPAAGDRKPAIASTDDGTAIPAPIRRVSHEQPAAKKAAPGVPKPLPDAAGDGKPNAVSQKVPPAPKGGPDGKTPKEDSAPTKVPTIVDADVKPINLPTTLALVAGQNPQVGFVQQRVQEAFARLEFAETLWVPSIRGGANYYKHEGRMQNAQGQIIDADRNGVFTGFGARAIGSGPPSFPGLAAVFDSGDALFQPIIARRTAAARQHGVTATVNNLLLQAAFAYVDLQVAVDQRRIANEVLAELQRMADLTASFAKRGQGTLADADRAQTELNLQKNVLIRTTEAINLASARLAEVLSLDSGMQLRPVDTVLLPMELVSADTPLDGLVSQALDNRPELHENAFEISAAIGRYDLERLSPFMPVVGAGLSYGGFGGGLANRVGNFGDRWDVDTFAYWEVRNLGFGERAARNLAASQVHQLEFRRVFLANRVRREVTEAYARLISARSQVAQAEASVKSALSSYQRNVARIRNAQGLPLEVLQSITALNNAKRDQLNAKANYNRAQFELHRALGWPIPR
jgi:outer membrane protein TolC